ncbi:hypothetical protein J5N97_006501 [Dioscorea zingiberensis]|uniref:Uncharacterized protein n=1 Tax=Dioscorea zingiberensis TaxID=325984 RepID=A0A9D5DA19_9LILI|nr:hypothetical protein J5N97_006501 [Dioscorea zingiberensis]
MHNDIQVIKASCSMRFKTLLILSSKYVVQCHDFSSKHPSAQGLQACNGVTNDHKQVSNRSQEEVGHSQSD